MSQVASEWEVAKSDDQPAPNPQPAEPSSPPSSPVESSLFETVREFERANNEFDYRPVPALVPVTAILGVCSATALLGVLGVPVALTGTILGGLCLVKFARNPGVYSGKIAAWIGFVLSVAFLVGGTALFAFHVATEVPDGYRRVNFTTDISKNAFVVEYGRNVPSPAVMALDGQKIFLKGFMYPQNKTKGLTSFILVKDNLQCCFGGNPAVTDMMLVVMAEGKTADYTQGKVSLYGTFRAYVPSGPGLDGDLRPVFRLEGDGFDHSRTPF